MGETYSMHEFQICMVFWQKSSEEATWSPRCIWGIILNMNLENYSRRCGLHSFYWIRGINGNCCEDCNIHLGSVKWGEVFDQLNNGLLFKNSSLLSDLHHTFCWANLVTLPIWIHLRGCIWIISEESQSYIIWNINLLKPTGYVMH